MGWRQFRRAWLRSSLPPFPIIKTGIDCDRDARERHDDPTRPAAFYDGTYELLLSCGAAELGEQ